MSPCLRQEKASEIAWEPKDFQCFYCREEFWLAQLYAPCPARCMDCGRKEWEKQVEDLRFVFFCKNGPAWCVFFFPALARRLRC